MTGTLNRGAVNGRWGAMVTLSSGPRRWAAEVHARWAWLRVLKLLRCKPRRLIRLSMIAFARWSLVDRVPAEATGTQSTSLGRPFLLFESNFNGDSDGYLESFSLIVPRAMNRQWLGRSPLAYDVPDARDTSVWLDYINREKQPIAFYYSAYPQASVKTVRSALALERMVDDFRARAGSMNAQTFDAEFRALLTRLQRIRNPRLKRRRRRATGSLTTFVRIGDAARRRRLVEGLDRLTALPLPVPDATHFARWCIVDRLKMPERYRKEQASYLLFSAWFDGDPLHYPGALFEQLGSDRVAAIWGSCGFEGTDAAGFADYLWPHRVKTGTAFAGYDGVTVREVRTALDLWQEFHAFAVASQAQRRTGAALKQAWMSEPVLAG